MTKTSKTAPKRASKKSAKSAVKNTVKPLYPVSGLKKTASKTLWVAFPVGNTANAYVYSSTLSRDKVRCATRKIVGSPSIDNIRARRVSSYRKMIG